MMLYEEKSLYGIRKIYWDLCFPAFYLGGWYLGGWSNQMRNHLWRSAQRLHSPENDSKFTLHLPPLQCFLMSLLGSKSHRAGFGGFPTRLIAQVLMTFRAKSTRGQARTVHEWPSGIFQQSCGPQSALYFKVGQRFRKATKIHRDTHSHRKQSMIDTCRVVVIHMK
jgi:hypothetical protein